MGARLGQGRLTDVNGNFSDGNFCKGLPQGYGLQRKGPEVIVVDKKNTVSLFTVPEHQEKIGNFIQKVMAMIWKNLNAFLNIIFLNQ